MENNHVNLNKDENTPKKVKNVTSAALLAVLLASGTSAALAQQSEPQIKKVVDNVSVDMTLENIPISCW